VLKTPFLEALSNTRGITTSSKFPKKAYAIEKEVGSLRGLDKQIAYIHFTINSL
jgi:hypothetical protein